eukprot:SAG22_NODE_4169_length_1360_cov_1.027756_2_plen_126_part_01
MARVNRQQLVATLQRDVATAVSVYDAKRQAKRLTEVLRTTVFSTVALEASAVGVGGLVAAATLDLSGLAASGLLAATGLLILPYQRHALKKQFRGDLDDLQKEVDEFFNDTATTEIYTSVAQIETN